MAEQEKLEYFYVTCVMHGMVVEAIDCWFNNTYIALREKETPPKHSQLWAFIPHKTHKDWVYIISRDERYANLAWTISGISTNGYIKLVEMGRGHKQAWQYCEVFPPASFGGAFLFNKVYPHCVLTVWKPDEMRGQDWLYADAGSLLLTFQRFWKEPVDLKEENDD